MRICFRRVYWTRFITNNSLNRIPRNPFKHKEHKELVNKNQLWECYGAGNLRMIWHK